MDAKAITLLVEQMRRGEAAARQKGKIGLAELLAAAAADLSEQGRTGQMRRERDHTISTPDFRAAADRRLPPGPIGRAINSIELPAA